MKTKFGEITETGYCDCKFTHNNIPMRFWIITGGIPALSFENYSFSKRYARIPAYSNKHWNNDKYDHQKLGDFPNPYEIIGEKEIQKYIDENYSNYKLTKHRLDILGNHIESPRFHDEDNHCYFQCEIQFRYYVPVVTATSRYYAGRCVNEIQKFANDDWKKLMNCCEMLCSKYNQIHEIPDNEFDYLVYLVNEVRK